MSQDEKRGEHDHGEEDLLSPKGLSKWLGVPESTIYRWNYMGTGPRPYKIGRHLRFSRREVIRWLATRRRGGRSS